MRRTAWMLPLALLLAAGTSVAQMPPPAFQVAVSPASPTVVPGNSTQLEVKATRSCPSLAAVLDDQAADVIIHHPAGIAVASVGQAVFRSQVCASQPEQVVAVPASITVPSGYDGLEVVELRIEVRPHPAAGPNAGNPGEPASVTAVVRVERASTLAQASSDEEPPLEAPAIPAILLAVALLAGAFALRRR